MAQTLSTFVSNTLASPPIVNPVGTTKGSVQTMSDTTSVPISAIGDTIIFSPIPVNAVLQEVEVEVASLGSTGIVEIGLFQKGFAGGVSTYTAVSANCIASGLIVTPTLSYTLADARFHGLTTDTTGQPAWVIAGLSQSPAYSHFYLGLTVTTATTAAGQATVTAKFVE